MSMVASLVFLLAAGMVYVGGTFFDDRKTVILCPLPFLLQFRPGAIGWAALCGLLSAWLFFMGLMIAVSAVMAIGQHSGVASAGWLEIRQWLGSLVLLALYLLGGLWMTNHNKAANLPIQQPTTAPEATPTPVVVPIAGGKSVKPQPKHMPRRDELSALAWKGGSAIPPVGAPPAGHAGLVAPRDGGTNANDLPSAKLH